MSRSGLDEFHQKYPHLQEFMKFLALLNEESDRGSVLISTGFIEQQLRDTLVAFMLDVPATATLLDGGNAPLGTFSSRISACYSLGLISGEEHHDLNQLRRIRNAFAHDIHTSFDTASVKDRCANLKMKAHDYDDAEKGEVIIPPKGQFTTAATKIILNLVNRPHYVSKRRLQCVDWEF